MNKKALLHLCAFIILLSGVCTTIQAQNNDPTAQKGYISLDKMYQAILSKNEKQYQSAVRELEKSGVARYLVSAKYLCQFGEMAHQMLIEQKKEDTTAYRQVCKQIEAGGMTKLVPSYPQLKTKVEQILTDK